MHSMPSYIGCQALCNQPYAPESAIGRGSCCQEYAKHMLLIKSAVQSDLLAECLFSKTETWAMGMPAGDSQDGRGPAYVQCC